MAREELEAAGFEILTYVGCESFATGMKRQIEELGERNPACMEGIVELAVKTCEHPAYRDATDHLCFVVKRPLG